MNLEGRSHECVNRATKTGDGPSIGPQTLAPTLSLVRSTRGVSPSLGPVAYCVGSRGRAVVGAMMGPGTALKAPFRPMPHLILLERKAIRLIFRKVRSEPPGGGRGRSHGTASCSLLNGRHEPPPRKNGASSSNWHKMACVCRKGRQGSRVGPSVTLRQRFLASRSIKTLSRKILAKASCKDNCQGVGVALSTAMPSELDRPPALALATGIFRHPISSARGAGHSHDGISTMIMTA